MLPFQTKMKRYGKLPFLLMTAEGEIPGGGGAGYTLGKAFGITRKKKVECSFENTFYAYKIEPSQALPQGNGLFTYFVVLTKFGLWDFVKNNSAKRW